MDVFLAWTLRVVRSSQVALMKGSDFVWLECTYHTVQYTSIVEEDQILFVPKARHEYEVVKIRESSPVVWINQLGIRL